MRSKKFSHLAAFCLALMPGITAVAQTYSNTVISLNPAGYWPLNETAAPPQPLNLTANNLGSLGTAGNGFYGAWYQAWGNQWYLTNNIVQSTGATSDGDKGLNCQFAPGQYVILPRNTNGSPNGAITINAPFSIETWVQVGTTAGRLGDLVSEGQVQLNIGGPNTNNPYYGGTGGTAWAGFELGQYANFFFFSCYNTNAYNNKSSELDSPKNLVVGQWVHLVVTFDGAVETMFENGVQVAQKTVAANAAGLRYVPDPTSPLMIGAGGVPSITYGTAFTGILDEVAIYPEVLPLSSIQTHYQTAGGTNLTYGGNYTNAVLADNPTIYFRMNDAVGQASAGYPSGTFPVATNYGSAGTGANGVYQPGTTPGVAGPGYAGFGAGSRGVAINGWLGAVDVGNSNLPAALNPTGPLPLTMVSWFQTAPADAPGRFQEIVGHSDSSYRLSLGQNGAGGDMHFNPGPGPELQFTSPSDIVTNGYAFNDGQWHMIAGVSDGTNEYLYLDGQLARTNGNATGINIVGTTRDLLLGGDPQYTFASRDTPNTIRNFDGNVAQVAFWTNALSGAQIQTLFNVAGVPPYIWQEPPVSVVTNALQNLAVFSGIRGSAPVTYQWYQNGTALTGQTNASLVFTPVSTNNAGNYVVIANNSFGSVTSSVVNLTVFGLPAIQQQSLTDMRIFAGASPVLHVTAVGAQPIYYQWSSNSLPITGATNSSLTLSNLPGSGIYTCFLTNAVGTNGIMPISVTMLADPTAPYPAQVLADKPAYYFRLDEADTGYPNDGVVAYDYAGGNNGSYSNTALAQASYSTATDPTETSANFASASSANSYMGNVPSYLTVATPSGSNAQFSVEAWVNQSFTPNNDAGLVTIGYGFGGEEFALDCGGNDANLSYPHSIRFYVNSATKQNYGVASTFALANNPGWHHVVAVCDQAGGHLYLYIDGMLQGSTAIPAGAGIQGETSPLAIGSRLSTVSATAYDNQFFGEIDDVAIYRYALSQAQVQAHYYQSGVAPIITGLQPSSNWTTNQAANVPLTVSVFGTPPISYQWLDNTGTPIPWGTNATVVLTNVQPGQAGTYTVNVSNLYGGPTSTNLNLTVTQAPQIVTDITPSNVAVYATSPVTLTVVVSGTPPLHYQWFQNGAAILNATNSTYSFAALLGTNTYYLSVTNINSGGTPTLSSTATVAGMPSVTLSPASYTDHMKITFAGYNRGETLPDFPVLVRLSTNIMGFSYSHFASPTAGDLRFTDSGGTRVIPSEVDEWNPNGESTVWVQMPALTGTNDFIWAYWGNPSSTTPAPGTNVWVPQAWEGLPNYDVVYHLKEGAFPFADSSGQNPALTGVAPAQTNGVVGTGGVFDGATTFLDAGNATLANQFTLSAWVNAIPTTNPNGIETVWANQKGGFGSAGFAMFINFYQTTNGDYRFSTGDGVNGTENGAGAGTVAFGQWHLLSAAVNQTGSHVTFYVDGTSVGGTSTVNDFPIAGVDLNLGRFTNSSLYFLGTMDEARIHAGIDSSNWVWASWMTVQQNSNLEHYASVVSTVTNAPTPVTIHVGFAGGNLTLSGSGGSAGGTYYVIGATNLTLPLAQWTVLSTNSFDGSGNFNVNVPVDVTRRDQFLRIKQ